MIESISNKLSSWRFLLPILLLFLVGTTLLNLLGAMQSVASIRTSGTIKAVGVSVFSNSEYTTALSSIDWGS